jgi:hypothetical protein
MRVLGLHIVRSVAAEASPRNCILLSFEKECTGHGACVGGFLLKTQIRTFQLRKYGCELRIALPVWYVIGTRSYEAIVCDFFASFSV